MLSSVSRAPKSADRDMDYLRSIGSAAASSLLQKSGLTFPFALGEKVVSFEGKTIWTLHDATKRDDGSQVSVFTFDANVSNRRNLLPLAKNALRKLRTTRHPDVLKFIEVVETETTIYIVTERVQPLSKVLTTWQTKPAKARDEWLIWGLHRILVALAFLNDSCKSTHGNLRVDSIFISPSGEWKLGGFDVLSSPSDDEAVLYNMGSLLPNANDVASPEVKAGGWSVLKDSDPAAADSYALGLLLHAVFNPTQPPPPTIFPPHPPPPPSARGGIPPTMFPSYRRLLNPNPKTRFTSKSFLQLGMGETPGDGMGFFANNGLVKICIGLEGFPLANESEKNTLIRTLRESSASFPTEFACYKVLPSLLSSLEHGGASAAQVLPLALQLGKNLAPSEYPNLVVGPLVRLFASPDRGTRMALLDHLSEYADKLDNRTVSDKVWPNLQTGFADTVAVIREATVRSILLIAPKLSERILNNDLLRHLAKTQTDPEASIRTNTCVLLGRIAPSLGYNTKKKVLIPAFTRSLKDTFVHARVAGLMAMMATIDCFDAEDVASKVIPSMSFCLIDKEKLVRDQAFKAMETFLKRVEAHAATLPETTPTAETPTTISGTSVPPPAGLANSAAGAAGALAGWAFSGLSKTLATSDLQSNIGGGAAGPPQPPAVLNGTTSHSASNKVASVDPFANVNASASSGTKGMQLGGPKRTLGEDLAAESSVNLAPGGWADEEGDLMDVAADTGDWSEFASAPGAPQMEDVFDPDGWGDMLDPSGTKSPSPAPPPMSLPNLSSFAPAPRKPPVPKVSPVPRSKTPQPPSVPVSHKSSITASPPAVVGPSKVAITPTPSTSQRADIDGWDEGDDSWKADNSGQAGSSQAPATPMSAMSKEEKAAEMARKREERKQRIAQLKEQKKGGTKS